ncbi:PREDICTED: transcription factor Adf-1-like [Rhagoletis zephyria]|uniref:transcription factor Adf-1-like n=1 Tax=Rhagoletis zephyria TaxID=28612 RepID=UPI00081120B8|nr:PREDICTED: transcription factor Adf-1-like [Rhagoletis zephyria]
MDLDEILIEEVRNHPLLYDLAHMEYKNLRRKDYAWKEVAANTKLSELECKKRWKSLRDSYKRCKRMDQLASGSSAETPREKWRHCESLPFFENISNSRRTIGSISADDTQFIEESEVMEIVDVNSANNSQPAIERPQR